MFLQKKHLYMHGLHYLNKCLYITHLYCVILADNKIYSRSNYNLQLKLYTL